MRPAPWVAALALGGLGLACGTPAARLPARPPAVVTPPAPPAPDEEASAKPGVPLPEPPRVAGARALEGFLATGASRPHARSLDFDVEALPVAAWGEPPGSAGFSIAPVPDGYRLLVSDAVFAEVLLATMPAHDGTAPVAFTAFTGGTFSQGAPPICGPGHAGTLLARWAGFAPRGWTDRGLEVQMADGDFSLAACRAVAKAYVTARAAAIVPGFVYGLRVRQDESNAGDETLYLLMPRAPMVAASGDPTTPLSVANSGVFTRLSFHLHPGASGAASLRISAASLALWSRLRAGGSGWGFADRAEPHDDLLVGVDVAWQGDDKVASISFALPKTRDAGAYSGLLAAVDRASR